MTGTKDILIIHSDGEEHCFQSDCLTAANVHLDKFRESIRAMHFGITKTVFKGGKAIVQIECSREQFRESF